jgi:competence protein ComEC
MFKLNQKAWGWFYGVGLGVLGLAIFQAIQMGRGPSINFLDVGQGDSILIQTPEFHQILIDAGPGSAVVDELGMAMGFFDRSIDLFILSHPDRDHFAGVLDAMQKYRIERILMTGVASEDSMYHEFLSQAKANGVQIELASDDRDIQIGPDLYLDVLYPLKGQNLTGQVPSDKNNTSTMAKLVQKDGNIIKSIALLNGDAEFPEEFEVLAAGADVTANILKLGHHGSKFATSDWFLKAVSPKTVAISVGAGNSYGHPNPETLERVKGVGVKRTDREGTITFEF